MSNARACDVCDFDLPSEISFRVMHWLRGVPAVLEARAQEDVQSEDNLTSMNVKYTRDTERAFRGTALETL